MRFIIIWLEREEGLMRVERQSNYRKLSILHHDFVSRQERTTTVWHVEIQIAETLEWNMDDVFDGDYDWPMVGFVCVCMDWYESSMQPWLSSVCLLTHSFFLFSNEFFCHRVTSFLTFYDFVLIIAGTWTNDNLIWGWKTFLWKNGQKMGHFLRQFFFYGKLGIRESQQFMTRKEWMKLQFSSHCERFHS